jgi:insulysin
VSKPSRYLSYVVGHEGAGSLYALFHANGWIESLSAGASTKMADMEIFKVCSNT